jgi:hypothetical protein
MRTLTGQGNGQSIVQGVLTALKILAGNTLLNMRVTEEAGNYYRRSRNKRQKHQGSL